MKALRMIDRISQHIYDHIMMISGSLVAGLIIVSALLRYVFKIDFYGSSEYILLAGFWLYFTGSVSAARGKSHLNADMITVFTHDRRVIRIFAVIRDVLSLAICCMAISWCWNYWSWQWKLHPVTSVHRIPLALQQFPMVFSFVLWGLYLVRDCIAAVMALRGADTDEPEGGNKA